MDKRILIKGAKLLDISTGYKYLKKDVVIKDGLIDLISDDISYTPDMHLIEADGYILSPGFIDIHTHVYPNRTKLGIDADIVGIHKGVTTIFDAGSQGPENFNDFYENVILKNKTSVYSLLNIAKTGLEKERYEIADISNIDINLVKEVYEKNKEFIKGIKARASASTVGDLGMKPIELAKKVSKDINIPIMIHIGNFPPSIEDVLSILEEGDIITHTFHGKPNGILKDNKIKSSFIKARDRGVLFDVGHGTSSFNFKIFKTAAEEGFYPDFISTDIYVDNYKGPVYSLEHTINKMIGLGMTIEDCIYKVTYLPAKHFELRELGRLKVGFKADLTLFKVAEREDVYIDSERNLLKNRKSIDIHYILKDGEIIDLKLR
jgi:dihydroorotase